MFKLNQLTKRVVLGLSVMGLLTGSQPVRSYYSRDNADAIVTLASLGLCVSTLLYLKANYILQDAIPNEPVADKRNAVHKSALVSTGALLWAALSMGAAMGAIIHDAMVQDRRSI